MPKFKFIACSSVTILVNSEYTAMSACPISTLTLPFYFSHPNTSLLPFMHMHTQHTNRPHILQTWVYTLTHTPHILNTFTCTHFTHTYTLTSHITHTSCTHTHTHTHMCVYISHTYSFFRHIEWSHIYSPHTGTSWIQHTTFTHTYHTYNPPRLHNISCA